MRRLTVSFLSVLVCITMDLADGEASAQTTFPAHFLELDGRMVRVLTAGMTDRAPEQPVVVFEAGAGSTLEAWNPILSAVVEFAPVVAYDRPGLGQSDVADEPPTPEWVADHLHALLGALDVAPPYVLVGHSWGGPLVRYFAGRYSDEVAGVVYVDPMDFTLTREDELALWDSIGVGEAEYDAARATFREETRELRAQMPPGLRAESEVIEAFQSQVRRQLPAMPDVPLAFLIAGRKEELPPGIVFPFDYSQYLEANVRQRVARFSELVLGSSQATLVLVTHSGHFIQNDDPDLVVEAIQRVVLRN